MNRPSDFQRALDDILTLVISDKKKEQALIDSVICSQSSDAYIRYMPLTNIYCDETGLEREWSTKVEKHENLPLIWGRKKMETRGLVAYM